MKKITKMLTSLIAMTLIAGTAPLLAETDDSMVLEMAYFKLRPGVTDHQVLTSAQKIQDDFLPKYDGRIYREFVKGDDGLWIDSIHWRSIGDFRKAAKDVLTDPTAAPMMELLDMSSMAWFHGFLKKSWSAEVLVPDGKGFTEYSLFRLVEAGNEEEGLMPTTEEEFLAAADGIQKFVEAQDGFVTRELFQTKDNWWVDLVHWNSRADFEKASQAFNNNVATGDEAAMSFIYKIDPKSLKMFKMDQMQVWQ